MQRYFLMVLLHDHTSIVTAKTKSIAQGSPHNSLLGLFKGKIQTGIQFRVVCEVVDRRRDYIMLNTHDTGYGFYHTSCAKAVAGHGFRGTDVQIICMVAKHIRDGLYFGNIA